MTDGKVALITGGATGIGAATARQLAARGVRVAICDVNAAAGGTLADELQGTFIDCDVTRYESVASAVAQCLERFGALDYAHLNAGVMTVPTGEPFLAIEDVSEDQYRRIIGVNLDGVFFATKAVLPHLRGTGGAITITASVAAFGMLPIDPLYSATKHSLVGFARSVAAANADANVRINVICPGVVDTAIVPDAFRDADTIMSTDTMATEVVDLLERGANGEVRAKVSGAASFAVPPIDINALAVARQPE